MDEVDIDVDVKTTEPRRLKKKPKKKPTAAADQSDRRDEIPEDMREDPPVIVPVPVPEVVTPNSPVSLPLNLENPVKQYPTIALAVIVVLLVVCVASYTAPKLVRGTAVKATAVSNRVAGETATGDQFDVQLPPTLVVEPAQERQLREAMAQAAQTEAMAELQRLNIEAQQKAYAQWLATSTAARQEADRQSEALLNKAKEQAQEQAKQATPTPVKVPAPSNPST